MEHESTAAATVRRAWHRAIDGAHDQIEAVLERHREAHRRYHTVEHVAAVVSAVDELGAIEEVDDINAIRIAAIYHDAIYDSRATDNEASSADLARRDLMSIGWSSQRVDAVTSMIRGTVDHRFAHDSDHAVLFDADLSILGAPTLSYDHYVAAVRAEYAHVSNQQWADGRSIVLRSFLDRHALFHTEPGRQRWEHAARSNLLRELEELAQS